MKPHFQHKTRGFTLIEIMLVLAIMAVMLTAVQLNFDLASPNDKVEKEANRFHAVFQLASDYSQLNNVQLGLVTDEISYSFVAYDGDRWMMLSEERFLEQYELEEGFSLELSLGDIPWLEDALEPGEGLFDDDEEEDDEDDEKKIIPQVYIFSSGDITPFTLTFVYEEEFSNDDAVAYDVKGEYAIPLTVDGPVEYMP